MMPDSAKLGNIYASIGKAYSDINNYDDGIESYMTALIYEPENPDHLLNLAKMHDSRKNLSEALRFFEAYDAHQNEMIRRIAESRGIDTDSFIISGNHSYARLRIKKIKEELFFMGEIKKINS
jgi:tetratricopeptide (TPR) repeat protein